MRHITVKTRKKHMSGHLSHDFGMYVGRKIGAHRKKKEDSKKEPANKERRGNIFYQYDFRGPFGPFLH